MASCRTEKIELNVAKYVTPVPWQPLAFRNSFLLIPCRPIRAGSKPAAFNTLAMVPPAHIMPEISQCALNQSVTPGTIIPG